MGNQQLSRAAASAVTVPLPHSAEGQPAGTDRASDLSAPEHVAPPEQPAGGSLWRRALVGSAWILVGQFASNGVRLATNLILTRLLFPEAFGLMALVNTFLVGLQMFSDIGIGPSVVHHRRGEDPAFLRTAWTIQVIRGALLWGCSAVLAWPLATFYGQPEVVWLLPALGLTAFVSGFNSTALFTYNRRLEMGRLTLLDLASQAISAVAMCALAVEFRSVWVLVIGNLIGMAVRAVLSHVVLVGVDARFGWDREAARELARFGRWIFLGTVLTYFCLSADRLVLGFFLSSAELGVYSVGYMLAQVVVTTVQGLSDKMIFPVYARLAEADPAELRAKVFRLRTTVLAVALPAVCGLAILSPTLISFLYDARYQDAGWMLRVLALGSLVPISTATLTPMILAKGDSFRHLVLLAVRVVVTVAAMVVGGWLRGSTGLLVGYAVAPVLCYPVLVIGAFRPYRVWMPWLDLCAAIIPAIIIALGVVLL